MMNLGAFYYEKDEYAKAIEWQEGCIAIGQTFPGVIETYQEDLFFNLAAFYDAQWQWLGIQEDYKAQRALLEHGLAVIQPYPTYTVPLTLTLKLRLAKWHIAAFQKDQSATDKEKATQLITEVTEQIEPLEFSTVSDQWMELEFLKIQLKGME
jgi:tetratricopeptide (TPR) repeat protein